MRTEPQYDRSREREYGSSLCHPDCVWDFQCLDEDPRCQRQQKLLMTVVLMLHPRDVRRLKTDLGNLHGKEKPAAEGIVREIPVHARIIISGTPFPQPLLDVGFGMFQLCIKQEADPGIGLKLRDSFPRVPLIGTVSSDPYGRVTTALHRKERDGTALRRSHGAVCRDSPWRGVPIRHP